MKKEDMKHNTNCQSELHDEHLCYILSQGFNLSDKQEYEALTENPQFKCKHCGRKTGSARNLCEPVEL